MVGAEAAPRVDAPEAVPSPTLRFGSPPAVPVPGSREGARRALAGPMSIFPELAPPDAAEAALPVAGDFDISWLTGAGVPLGLPVGCAQPGAPIVIIERLAVRRSESRKLL